MHNNNIYSLEAKFSIESDIQCSWYSTYLKTQKSTSAENLQLDDCVWSPINWTHYDSIKYCSFNRIKRAHFWCDLMFGLVSRSHCHQSHLYKKNSLGTIPAPYPIWKAGTPSSRSCLVLNIIWMYLLLNFAVSTEVGHSRIAVFSLEPSLLNPLMTVSSLEKRQFLFRVKLVQKVKKCCSLSRYPLRSLSPPVGVQYWQYRLSSGTFLYLRTSTANLLLLIRNLVRSAR